jgi:hypothetical protein
MPAATAQQRLLRGRHLAQTAAGAVLLVHGGAATWVRKRARATASTKRDSRQQPPGIGRGSGPVMPPDGRRHPRWRSAHGIPGLASDPAARFDGPAMET